MATKSDVRGGSPSRPRPRVKQPRSPSSAARMPPPPPKATRRPSDACSEAGSDATDIGSEASSVSSTRKRPLELTEASYPQLTGASHPLKPSGGASVNGGASTSSALANAGGWLEAVAKRPARRAVATHLDGNAARVPSASAVASVEGGCCKWCLCSLTMQHPDGESKCRSRIFPNIRDWKKTSGICVRLHVHVHVYVHSCNKQTQSTTCTERLKRRAPTEELVVFLVLDPRQFLPHGNNAHVVYV